jgi:uncharacterized protein YcbX
MAVISEIWRYPFKSMAGERLREVELTQQGVRGDRRFAFIDSEPQRAGKLLTARQAAGLLRYHAAGEGTEVSVRSPSGASHSPTAPGLQLEVSSVVGRQVTVSDGPGEHFDETPVLLLNLATLQAVEQALGFPLDLRRFRANLYLSGLRADEELEWQQRRLRAGSALLEVVRLCERCLVTTIDPDTLERRPEVLRTVVQTREGNLGLRCSVIEPGIIREGDVCVPQ